MNFKFIATKIMLALSIFSYGKTLVNLVMARYYSKWSKYNSKLGRHIYT